MSTREIIFAVFGVLGLMAVRFLAPMVFYDPLIAFFHQVDYQINVLPEIQYFTLFISLLIRFVVNSVLSLVLIKSLFKRSEILEVTAVLFGITFLILTPILFYLIWDGSPNNYQFLFYVRRILIHPILTLVLIPAYLYHQNRSKSKSKKEME